MSFVELQNIEKRYGDLIAVDDVSLSVEEGEFVAILGPSGSGKTTTLRMLAGFEESDSGDIRVDDQSIAGRPPEDRSMSMVFQRLGLFPHMTVEDNIAFGLKMRTELSKAEISERVSEVLEMVELPGYEERGIADLSGGEQQRVALARAIVVEPKVLLFDEPLSDLDRQLRENMRREIGDLHRRLNITSLYVTHNQREALTLADRIAVMRDGKIVRVGTPEEIYNDPQSEFVANFVGDSNFLDGTLTKNGHGWQFESNIVSLPIETAPSHNGEVSLFIRPEDITLSDNAEGPSVSGTVTSATHLGSTTEYSVEVDGREFLVVELGPPKYRSGDSVIITFNDYGLVRPT